MSRIKEGKLRIAREKIEKVIREIDLMNMKEMFSSRLSGGQKRKLSLGMSIVNENEIMILDEPSSGLDPTARLELWGIIKRLKEKNKTVIMSSHYLDEMEYLCDRMAIMSNGRLLVLGTADYIKKKFGIGYTLTLHNIPTTNNNNNTLYQTILSRFPSLNNITVQP